MIQILKNNLRIQNVGITLNCAVFASSITNDKKTIKNDDNEIYFSEAIITPYYSPGIIEVVCVYRKVVFIVIYIAGHK